MQGFQQLPPRVERRFSNFPVKKKERHALPTQRIPSRLCHAEIWSLYGLKKEVSITLIKLSKASRAFIISQEGLKGFCLHHFDAGESFNFYWKTISTPVIDLLSELIPEELLPYKYNLQMSFRLEDKERLCTDLAKLPKFCKEDYLRHEHPSVYLDFLWWCGRHDELFNIWPAEYDITPHNYSWYIYGDILARVNF